MAWKLASALPARQAVAMRQDPMLAPTKVQGLVRPSAIDRTEIAIQAIEDQALGATGRRRNQANVLRTQALLPQTLARRGAGINA